MALLILMISFATYSFYESRKTKVASNEKSVQNYNDQDKDVLPLENKKDLKMSTTTISSDKNENKNRSKNVQADVTKKINLDTGLSNGRSLMSNIINDQDGKRVTQPSSIIKDKETLKSPVKKRQENTHHSDINSNHWANTHEENKGSTSPYDEPLKTSDKKPMATIIEFQNTSLRGIFKSLNPIPSATKPLRFSREILPWMLISRPLYQIVIFL